MSEPTDDTPPPEELEMATEEALGHPLTGDPLVRISALTKRLTYLEKQVQQLWTSVERDAGRISEIQPALNKLHDDMDEARTQLEEWKMKHTGRN